MNDEWIEHDGGACPVDPRTRVQVKFRDGVIDLSRRGCTAYTWSVFRDWWKHEGNPDDNIIAYRVVSS